ncbi:hypothetical protein ACFX2C_047000 [Malus domestica]
MPKNLTLADSYALVEKHSLWDEAKRSQKSPKQPCKDAEPIQKKASDKPLNEKISQEEDTGIDPLRSEA